ncbi:response regulator transcription factor [Sporosarcina gallistercoris]|uniref:Response regulator transcription factor n=1 Tax=Sporosarcina gallistercoris TaxID=2762245 RepID=A0ABR8PHD2_9BACL|nr:response regulator transcription factor [Sporosarcina gallistercoris]MBD7907573.1 response regulator transcription factor [Sporosarcina gallistercoris]
MKILVIEDNESVSQMIGLFFEKEGIAGEFVMDGKTGLERAQQDSWDCLIIDWMLPSMDGVTICRSLRKAGDDVPIIMLTAKDGESDQVLGLEMGADDYVTKPFSPLALMARIRAVTRRRPAKEAETNSVLETIHFRVDENAREVFADGVAIENLTPKEYDLLVFFIRHPKQVFSRDQLLERVWGFDFYGDDRTVDVHIKRLRTKISRIGMPVLHTVWGVGYKFDESEEASS